MRVLYDHQIFQEQSFGGVSRYFMELYSAGSDFEPEIAVRHSDNRHLLAHPELAGMVRPFRDNMGDFLPQLDFRGKGRLYDLLCRISRRPRPAAANREHSLRVISAGRFDVFHPTYFDPYFLEAIGSRPFVVTVFDMIHEIFPEHLSLADPASQWKRLLCDKASRIIAISHATKADLIEHFRVDPGKIDVVHLASSLKGIGEAAPPRLPDERRFLLYTGSRSGYKNFFFFAGVVAEIFVRFNDLRLVCTGEPLSALERSYLERLSIAHLVEAGPVSDDELARLYAGAEMLIIPSLYEGFGMPILEACACGCPLVLSDTPAMREIAGDAALYFKPKSAPELGAAIERILGDDDLRAAMTRGGAHRARDFSWSATAQGTAEVYRRALGSAGHR